MNIINAIGQTLLRRACHHESQRVIAFWEILKHILLPAKKPGNSIECTRGTNHSACFRVKPVAISKPNTRSPRLFSSLWASPAFSFGERYWRSLAPVPFTRSLNAHGEIAERRGAVTTTNQLCYGITPVRIRLCTLAGSQNSRTTQRWQVQRPAERNRLGEARGQRETRGKRGEVVDGERKKGRKDGEIGKGVEERSERLHGKRKRETETKREREREMVGRVFNRGKWRGRSWSHCSVD